MTVDRIDYLTDYWTTEDHLRFSDFRPALVNVLTQAYTPLTIGVFGPWGSGKTSLLQMLKKDIEDVEEEEEGSASLRTVWFTAWKYDRHEALWRAFILRVLDALYPRHEGDGPWEERERIPIQDLDEVKRKQVERLDRLSRSLYETVEWEELGRWVMAWDKVGKEIAKVPAFLLLLSAGVGKVADEIGITPDLAELLQREVQVHRLEQLTSMEQFEATFQTVLTDSLGENGRLVVFVDDLDRCLPEKAIEVLEAIKLFLEIPGTAFVLGMNRMVIERGIEARYGDCFLHTSDRKPEFPISGDSYLQKIVQIPFYLPPLAVEDLREYIKALEGKVSSDVHLSKRTQEVFAHGLLPNPRQAKRALNIFRLLREIAEKRKMDVAWPLLAKTVLIQTQWPDLYRDWRQYPTLVQTLEMEYARQPFSDREAIRGRSPMSAEDREAEEVPAAGGLLVPYLSERYDYKLLERLLTFCGSDEEGKERTRFEGLGPKEMEIYVRLAGTVGAEQRFDVELPSQRLTEMLSGDRARIREAIAWLEEVEPDVDGPQHDACRQRLLHVIRDPTRPAVDRVSAGDALALMGDSRFRLDAWCLPNENLLGFIEVPQGKYTMGTQQRDIRKFLERFGGESEWYERETPQHEILLPAYYVARYPVTVDQFCVFMEDSGYKPGSDISHQGLSNHPVVLAVWRDALAYCRWLTEQLCAWSETPDPLATLLRNEGWSITLPSEAEWEKAARGTDARIFPWGERSDPELANYADTGIGRTSAVGCFPGGLSPYNVEDMSGNVWEWCRTKWENDYSDYQGDDDLKGNARRVLRGGSFQFEASHLRCAYRDFDPFYRYSYTGFRVVATNVRES